MDAWKVCTKERATPTGPSRTAGHRRIGGADLDFQEAVQSWRQREQRERESRQKEAKDNEGQRQRRKHILWWQSDERAVHPPAPCGILGLQTQELRVGHSPKTQPPLPHGVRLLQDAEVRGRQPACTHQGASEWPPVGQRQGSGIGYSAEGCLGQEPCRAPGGGSTCADSCGRILEAPGYPESVCRSQGKGTGRQESGIRRSHHRRLQKGGACADGHFCVPQAGKKGESDKPRKRPRSHGQEVYRRLQASGQESGPGEGRERDGKIAESPRAPARLRSTATSATN